MAARGEAKTSAKKSGPDPAAKAAAQKKVETLKDLLVRGDTCAWRAGRLFEDLVKTKVWQDAGAPSLDAWASEQFGVDEVTLRRYRRVASEFTERQVKMLTASKLDLGLTLLTILQPGATPRAPAVLRMTVPLPDGREVPFRTATVLQLEEALESLRVSGTAGETDDLLPESGGALRAVLEQELSPGKARNALPAPDVSLRAVYRDGKLRTLVTLRDIDSEALAKVGQALAKVAAKTK